MIQFIQDTPKGLVYKANYEFESNWCKSMGFLVEFEPVCNEEDDTVSNCCGALPRGDGDNDSEDYGICPDCKEHCEYVKESER
jgi:hypothetical protein